MDRYCSHGIDEKTVPGSKGNHIMFGVEIAGLCFMVVVHLGNGGHLVGKDGPGDCLMFVAKLILSVGFRLCVYQMKPVVVTASQNSAVVRRQRQVELVQNRFILVHLAHFLF